MHVACRTFRVVIAGLILFLVAACSPVMRDEKTPGSFAWFDLMTDSPKVSREFYAALFNWRFVQSGEDNVLVITRGRTLIGGMVVIDGEDAQANEARWQPVLSVSSTQAASARARAAGGHQIGAGFAGPTGALAAFQDPTGARLTLYDGTEGVLLGASPEIGTWVWVDLLTPSTSTAKNFYRKVVDFDTRSETRRGTNNYEIFTSGTKDRGGLIQVRRDQASPMWLPYVLVGNIDDAIAKATGLGAQLATRQGDVAILIDPANAVIGLAQHAEDT